MKAGHHCKFIWIKSCVVFVRCLSSSWSMKRRPSFARLSPLAKGRIIGMRQQGAERTEIRKLVRKKDGTKPSLTGIDNVSTEVLMEALP